MKVSFINDLNDPFELLSVDFQDPTLKRFFQRFKRILSGKLGLRCFSKSHRNPLLWSHYADRHKGVVLELDLADDSAIEVEYQKSRLNISLDDLQNRSDDDILFKLLTTKYIDWKNEEEVRVFLEPKQYFKIVSLSFFNLNGEISLKGIIAGSLCQLTENDILKNLPNGKSIKFMRTRLDSRSFNVVLDRIHETKIINNRA